MQGGVKNYLGNQKMVNAPLKWRSGPQHPSTELAYITKKEKDLLVKHDLHGSLKGGVNRGPSGIMSLNGWGSKDSSGNEVGMSGAATSAAETGSQNAADQKEIAAYHSGPALPPGVTSKDTQDYRAAFINAGGGQRVNPGFFDSRTTLSPNEIALAKAYRNRRNAKGELVNRFAKRAYKNTGQGGLLNMLRSGGIFGNLLRGVGQKFGLGKRYNEPTYDMSQYNNLTLGKTEEDDDIVPLQKPNNIFSYKDQIQDMTDNDNLGFHNFNVNRNYGTELNEPNSLYTTGANQNWVSQLADGGRAGYQGAKAEGITSTNAFNNSDSFANWNVNDEALYP